jgi:hypothetical protein
MIRMEEVPINEIKDYEIVTQLAHIWFDVRSPIEQVDITRLKDEMETMYGYLKNVPREWYQAIITTHIDVYLPPEQWLVVWKLSGFSKPAIQYGICTRSRIHDVLLRQFSYIDKHVEWIKQHFRPLESDDEICRRELGVMDYRYMIQSDSIMYAFYDSQSEHGEIIVGILCLYDDDRRKELFIPMLCTDGTYHGVGSRLMSYAKQLLVFQSPYKRIELDSLYTAVEFYKKQGFIQKPGNQMIWTPSYREIYQFIENIDNENFPTLYPIIKQKWPKDCMQFERDRERARVMELMKEAQYEKNAGTNKRRSHLKKGRSLKKV